MLQVFFSALCVYLVVKLFEIRVQNMDYRDSGLESASYLKTCINGFAGMIFPVICKQDVLEHS